MGELRQKLTTEVVGVVREPLVPGIEVDLAGFNEEVDSSLQNYRGRGSVDADPCGRSVLSRKMVSLYPPFSYT